MGRPEPSVLFAQTFVHPQLDEYVDEVLFSEPIVITACEFLEQGASSTAQAVSLVGATLPPSFAVEIFVHCEGESRFRRLCQPFLYSHSSSNVLEVEAVVTNHLVVRGSYRSLSLVIYGNTAEDLGQFNIELDDSSLTDLVGSVEGKLEDLPTGLHSTTMTMEDSISSLNVLSIQTPAFDIPFQVKYFLLMVLKILEIPELVDAEHKVLSTVVAVATSYISHDEFCTSLFGRDHMQTKSKISRELELVISDARKELLEVYKIVQDKSHSLSAELASDGHPEFDSDLPESKELVDMFRQFFHFERNISTVGYFQLSRTEKFIFGLSVALLLCSGREGCFHFVNGGGMDQLLAIFSQDTQNSTTVMLLLLGALERATRYSIGCEAFLGWWPREDENVPTSVSEGYSHLLKLLLTKPRHDIASLATCILGRLRLYELASRYESAVLCLLGSLSTDCRMTNLTVKMLTIAEIQLKKLLKLINSRGPIEDPSPVASIDKLLVTGQKDGLLSYGATSGLISSSNCCFSNWDIDYPSLSLLKERGFLSLSAALLSSSNLREAEGQPLEIFLDVVSRIEAVIFSFLFCRSGLVFLLQHPELSTTLIHALNGGHAVSKEDCLPLRYTSVLISKGFFCGPQEVGTMIGIHLRVVNAIDRLLTLTPNTEEFLWVLWELCGLSRSHCGRQALSALGYFPEVIKILIKALQAVKESESAIKNSGSSPVNLAIFHSAAEIVEVIVTDSTASSLASWIGDAIELHRGLHLSSPGSNRKDAPSRLLEWIDAGVVYHKHGGIGLLRYAAVLASGGDAQLNSTSILVSDLTDVENVVGDSSGYTDVNVMENIGKLASEKSFDGVALRDSSVAQLTTAFRILAFISENPSVAAVLYDEGAIIVIYVVLINCRYMLERASNTYDYLVDDGTECNTTSDLLLERNREQSIIDLLVPSLVLLTALLQKLQEAKELHRNTKLMNTLLRLHREVSPKLAACAADLFTPYPDSALGLGAVCHLIVSAVALWPVHGWSPGLFPSLLASVQTTSLLALGPKETCSLLSLLSDLFPDEGLWLWINGMPLLSALRMVAVGTLLGPQKESQLNWYLESAHLEKLLLQLTPQLEKIAQIIQQYAVSALVVIQDLLRVFIIRIARQKADNGCMLVRPLISWIIHQVSGPSPSETNGFKVFRLLDFLSSLMEHPVGKTILLREGVLQMLTKVLDKCFHLLDIDGKQMPESANSSKSSFTLASWCLPIFKSVSLLCCTHILPQYPSKHKMGDLENLSSEDVRVIICYILKSCQVLPVGKELVASLVAFAGLVSCNEGQSALEAVFSHMGLDGTRRADDRGLSYKIVINAEWKKYPPLLCCAKKLLRLIDSIDGLSPHFIHALYALAVGPLQFCLDGQSLNEDRVRALKCLFGVVDDSERSDDCPGENINYIQELVTLLSSKITADDRSDFPESQIPLYQVLDLVKSLSLLLQRSTVSSEVDNILSGINIMLPKESLQFLKIVQTMDGDDDDMADGYLCVGALRDKFLWECPETLPDRLSQHNLSAKRKMSSLDGPSRRSREGAQTEITAQSTFSRGVTPSAATGPTRRDTFRQRKPNTSRPPSMHVDDYVARERNVEGGTNSNVIAIPRVGSSSGRPPSIHVDEFMARERERQNSATTVVGEATLQQKTAAVNASEKEKVEKPKQLKAELDDDLQGIDIVFDGEESETDDKLPFLQPDDNLQQPASGIVEQSSPHSIVEETESDANENHQFPDMDTPLSSNIDENTQSEFSSRMSISRPELPLTREPSVSSEKRYPDQLDESKNLQSKHSGRHETGAINISGFPPSLYSNTAASHAHLAVDSRMGPQNFYSKNSPQHVGNVPAAAGSLGLYDHRFRPNQPPLPPMPPPAIISGVDMQHQMAFQVQSDYPSSFSNSTASLPSSLPITDSKYSRASASSPVRQTRLPPPLPPTPPSYASSPYNLPSVKLPASQSSPYTKRSLVTPEIRQASMAPSNDGRLDNLSNSGGRHLSFSQPTGLGIPPSAPLSVYGNTPNQQQGENLPSILQGVSISQSSIQSLHSIQLPPLQAPQLPRPPQPSQQLRSGMQASQQLEQGMSMQSNIQMQLHPLQMMQQAQVSPMNSYYQMQQQEYSHGYQQRIEQSHHQGDVASTQLEPEMSLQEYFKSPEAIQSLLSDRDKLCQLLEQHPKLMQMLQEKLGQL